MSHKLLRPFVCAMFAAVLLTVSLLGASQADAQGQANCLPSDLLMVVDHSGSMRGAKWTSAQQAFTYLLTTFANKLRFGLITFESKARLRVKVAPGTAAQCLSILRSISPTGTTAMKCALQDAYNHYKNDVIPNDPVKDRRRFVVLITDGQPNTCGSDVVPEVQKLRKIPVGGKNYDVKTYVIGFGSGVNKTQLQQMAEKGGTNKYYQADNLSDLQKALGDIANGASKELCDGKDNDCDGKVDEFTEQCQGGCGTGTRRCVSGQWGACSSSRAPGPEVCDNQDNDCDGKIDDGLTRDCSNLCGKGTETCVAGKWSGCTAPKSGQEDCNGKDDDCDGYVDEGLQKTCRTKCGTGTQACIQGDWSTCSAPQPQPVDRCDNVDNNCDGQVDEGATCPNGGRCVEGNCRMPCNASECPAGQLCESDGYCWPKTKCSPDCTAGQVCLYGKCVAEDCSKPEGKCAPNEVCRNKRCERDPCIGVQCAADQFCRDGICRHSCSKISCPKGQLCRNGVCQDDPCGGKICRSGFICNASGDCVSQTCSETCGSGQYCDGKNCVDDPCSDIQCPSGEKCVLGECYGPDGPLPPQGTTNSGSTNSGTTNSGTTNSGTTNSGTTNSGTTNSGTTNSGTTNSGTTNSGTTNSGTTNSGSNNSSGTTNSGTTNTGSTNSGSTNSGSTTSGGLNNGGSNSGGRDPGCLCSSSNTVPSFPVGLLLFLLFLPMLLRRRRS